VGLDTATVVEDYAPVIPLGAPECQPFTTRLLKVMRLRAHEESLPACPSLGLSPSWRTRTARIILTYGALVKRQTQRAERAGASTAAKTEHQDCAERLFWICHKVGNVTGLY